MTCAACQAGIQRALRRAPGVRDANVHLMLKSATVTFDPSATTPEKLVEVIRDTGYEAEVPVRRAAQEPRRRRPPNRTRSTARTNANSATCASKPSSAAPSASSR